MVEIKICSYLLVYLFLTTLPALLDEKATKIPVLDCQCFYPEPHLRHHFILKRVDDIVLFLLDFTEISGYTNLCK